MKKQSTTVYTESLAAVMKEVTAWDIEFDRLESWSESLEEYRRQKFRQRYPYGVKIQEGEIAGVLDPIICSSCDSIGNCPTCNQE